MHDFAIVWRPRYWLGLIGLLGTMTAAQALDLRGLLEAAQAEDPSLKAARAAAASGRERVPQAQAQLLPSLGLSGNWSHNKLDTTAPNVLGQSVTSHDRYDSQNQSLTLKQVLFRRPLALAYVQAAAYVQEAEAGLEQEMQNLYIRVTAAYLEALLAQDHWHLASAQRSATQGLFDAAQQLFAKGAGTRTDVEEARARLDLALAQLLEAQQYLDYTRSQVMAWMAPSGTSPPVELAPLDPAKLPLAAPLPPQLQDWLNLAADHSPDIRMLRARREVARLELDKASAGHLPTLDAVAQWSRSASENVTRINSRYDTKSIGLQWSIPLYTGGYVDSTERQALAELERAEQLLEAGMRDLNLRLHKEYRGVTEGALKVRAMEQALRSAEQALLSSQRSYAGGVRSLLDVLNAEQRKWQISRDLAQARYAYVMAKVRLQALAGTADLTMINDINGWLSP